MELKFINDIPSPPQYLNMNIVLKYYNITNSSLVKEEEEFYDFVLCPCRSNERISFSYGNMDGIIIVLKHHEISKGSAKIGKFHNKNARKICYGNGRTFILRLSFTDTSKRPTFPLVDVNIRLSNETNIDYSPLFDIKMIGWQIGCPIHDPDSLIENPVFIFDDFLQIKIVDIFTDVSAIATYHVEDDHRMLIGKQSSFHVENLKTYLFGMYRQQCGKKLMRKKSQLFEYSHKEFLMESVFVREELLGINQSAIVNYSVSRKGGVSSHGFKAYSIFLDPQHRQIASPLPNNRIGHELGQIKAVPDDASLFRGCGVRGFP
ncbi:hypothetical protein RF11_06461 [Thelohanellus kitauei]|uniref:Uncharacterized protein n=1 Tax=Thelohanellus kitauei TaxID=669202 RepID=A0A0C2J499_THEKT|nr:hypothetical protein RF11_06461 [Thelohanellus kitauei]